MWVPLASREVNSLLPSSVQHEIYLIDRSYTGEISYKKLMDARYAHLRSVEEQLNDD